MIVGGLLLHHKSDITLVRSVLLTYKNDLARCGKKLSVFKYKPSFSTSSLSLLSRQNPFKPQTTSIQCREEEEEEERRHHGIHILSHHRNPEISVFLQKGFSEITNLIIGRAIHTFSVKGLLHLSIFHSNTLLNIYSKFGKLETARSLFDEMPHRNEASWSTMISGYVRAGLYQEAIGLFHLMQDHDIKPNGFLLASLVTACSRSALMISPGIQIHGFVVKFGLLSDVFVSTALLHFYGTYGFMSDARDFFEEMPERNVVSWTSLMVGYSNNGDPEEAVKSYQRMSCEEVSCNQNSFATVICSCGLLEDELLGHQVLAHVVVSGFESNVSVANSLISMFDNFGNAEDARYVFDGMEERDTISWNSMISAFSHNGFCEESLKCFHQMRCANVKPDSATLSSLVSACSCVDNLKWGRGIHGLVVKLGLNSSVCVCNTLVTLYSESGKSDDAKVLFQEMSVKDLISWNSMLACHAQDGEYEDALKLLANLLGMSKITNHVTFVSALTACSSLEARIQGKIVHALIIRAGLQENLLLGNSLITMYGKCGMIREAKVVFQTMPDRDLVTWNVLIGVHSENGELHDAVKAFRSMRENGIAANYITLVNILGAFSAPKDLLKYGMPIHAHVVLAGFETDDYVKNSLLTMYAKCGDIDSSNFIFDGLVNKSFVSWNAMIAANAHHGHGEEALELFAEMRRTGMKLDQFSLSGGLAACASLAVLEEGKQLHDLFIKLGFDSDLHVMNAAMDMYGKCGEMTDLLKVLPEPSNRSRLSWNILISGFARHGCFEKAKEAFHEMLKQGLKPDHVSFVSLLSACSHGGLVAEGLAYFASMTSGYGVPQGIEHCVCIIDLLGRSGRLNDAVKFIENMPVPPNDLVWRSLLASCRTHGNLELGRKTAERLLELDPLDDSAFVLLSNVCAINRRWEDVEKVRSRMKLNNVTKMPACSWVKVKNKVSSFGIGDRTHPRAKQIYAKLEELLKMIKEAGYVPDTSFALHDMDEEQKEHNLWNHSEKIALAFGLISTPEGSTIKIFKNLRVCGDCHSVYKFISGIVEREIVLRDPYRFHHFNRGVCSCCDYW